jgi:hypothetical protein
MSDAMWVVWNIETGYSDEEMRFASKRGARDWINERIMPWNFMIRYESGSEHPQNHVAVGQILRDNVWLDYARDTPERAIYWAKREPAGTARVVDWIGKRSIIWEHGDTWDVES